MNFYKNTMKTGSTNIGFIDISKIARKSNFKFFQYFMSDTYKPSLIDMLYLFCLIKPGKQDSELSRYFQTKKKEKKDS